MNVSEQPQLPTTNIIQPQLLAASTEWFEYPVKAYPHQTDYVGSVWHGTYITWLEEARIEWLRSIGVEFADLVAVGCNMPVVELSIRYHLPISMGTEAVIKTRMAEMKGVRLNLEHEVRSPDETILYSTAQVTLVTVDLEKGKVMRQLPPVMKDALEKVR
ncbi:acyl-CoA thioesterase [Phormidesmis sp. 146-35]